MTIFPLEFSNREVSFFAVGALFYSDESTDLPGRKISGALHPDMTNNSISVYQKCPTARPRSPDHGRGGSLVDDQGFLWSSSSLNPAAQLTIESPLPAALPLFASGGRTAWLLGMAQEAEAAA